MSTSFTASSSPSNVAASEHALLSIARALVGEAGAEVEPVLRRARPNSPRTMGPTACALLEQTLARGVTMELMRRGGWRRESFVTGTSVERGRAFERHSKVPLRFTRASFDLLAWLRDVDVATPSRAFSHRASAALSLGDEVVAYLALDLLKPSDGAAHQPVFQNSPLCWLGHVGTLSRHATAPDDLDFSRLVAPSPDGPHRDASIVLECLQGDLTDKWRRIERGKATIKSIERMCTLGQAQQRVLDAFLGSADAAGRRDLATFLVDAAIRLLRPETAWRPGHNPHRETPPEPTHHYWIQELDLGATLGERQAAFAAAGAFLRGVARLGRWSGEHGAAHHFDDEYETSQMLLSRWDELGTVGFTRASRLARDLESLHTLGTTAEKQS